jgi:CRP-like cAMP-binding protein
VPRAIIVVQLANQLLERLPARTRSALTRQLVPVSLDAGQLLYEELVEQHFVYFPIAGVVSFLLVMASGASAEVGMVGREGLVGLAPVLGGKAASDRAVVQVAGAAWRMEAGELRQRVLVDRRLAAMLAQYAQAFLAQVAHTAVCNRLHTIRQQFCRWILMTLDRTGSGDFQMTQQAIANMLGTRRESVSAIASQLAEAGAIDYSRGTLRVTDRRVLAASACECYGQLKDQTRRLLDFG